MTRKSTFALSQIFPMLTGSASSVTQGPLPEDDPTQRKPDITKIKSALGWEPKQSFEAGLRLTVEWYRGHASWWRRIKSGEFAAYYKSMYEGRGASD